MLSKKQPWIHDNENSQFSQTAVISKIIQSCPTHCDLIDYTVQEILQARILEWVATPFSRYLPNPGMELRSPTLQTHSLPAEPQGKPIALNRLQYSVNITFIGTGEPTNKKISLASLWWSGTKPAISLRHACSAHFLSVSLQWGHSAAEPLNAHQWQRTRWRPLDMTYFISILKQFYL